MAKFVIACPNCGKYVEADSGFFAKKKVECACGYVINVRAEKMASRMCPHCGNTVVYDQSKGSAAKCPVCGESINTAAEQAQYTVITCGQCGIRLNVSKSAATCVCPVCGQENNVAERIAKEQLKNAGAPSVIKCEGDADTLVWKHPMEDFNWGSQLIVHESQEAIFFRDGQALDTFGSGRYTLETQKLPVMEKLYKLPSGQQTFHSEVYFINLATVMGIKWGTDTKVRLFDPASGMHVELGACGEFNIRVIQSRKLLMRLIGTTGGLSQEQLLGIGGGKSYFRGMVMTQVKSYLAQAIKACGINVLEIDEHLTELSDELRARLNVYLREYGLELTEFYVTRVMTPDDDPNFKRLKQQYAEQYLLVRQEQIKKSEAEAAQQRKAVEAQTAAQMQVIGAQGEADALRIRKQAEADAYRMQAEAEAMEMRMKGYTYQQETARQVGLGATAAMASGGSASGIGEVAGLGMTLGAMGGVIGMTKDAMSGLTESGTALGQAAAGTIQGSRGWDCPQCGSKGITFNFCPHCGAKKPEPQSADSWDCTCGAKASPSISAPTAAPSGPKSRFRGIVRAAA